MEDEFWKVRHVRQLPGESKSRAAGLWRKKPEYWASFFSSTGLCHETLLLSLFFILFLFYDKKCIPCLCVFMATMN